MLRKQAGRSVNSRYHPQNLAAMLHSRVESTRIVGAAIARRGIYVWLGGVGAGCPGVGRSLADGSLEEPMSLPQFLTFA